MAEEKYAATKEECNIVIEQNISKSWRLVASNPGEDLLPEQVEMLTAS